MNRGSTLTVPRGDAAALLAGLIGRGILQSRTPWMHEQEGAAQGLALEYALFDFAAQGWGDDHLPALLDELQGAGYAGVNITFPFKQAVIPLLGELSDGARRVGAVNTVSFANGKRTGHNTDVTGFADSLSAGLPDADLGCVLQLGCGGAGAATAHALLGGGAKRLLLCDSDSGHRDILIAQLSAVYGEGSAAPVIDLRTTATQASGIVNATPMGMDKFPGMAIADVLIEPRHWVADIVYFPLETALLRAARAKGCRTLDGSGMAIHQAASAFAIFTGHAPDVQRMSASFTRFTAR